MRPSHQGGQSRVEEDIHGIRTRVAETAKQADETRDRVAKVEGVARDAQHAGSRVPPPKTPEPGARLPETLVVYFRPADWTLDRSALLALERVLRQLRENPTFVVKLEGHTDNVGSSSLNLKLSQRRAQEVWTFLVMNGIKRNRIEAAAAGEAQPIASNQSSAGRDQNRRVALTLLAPSSGPGPTTFGSSATTRP